MIHLASSVCYRKCARRTLWVLALLLFVFLGGYSSSSGETPEEIVERVRAQRKAAAKLEAAEQARQKSKTEGYAGRL